MAAVGKKGAGSKRRGRVERAPAKRRLEARATAPARSAARAETPLPSAQMRSQATEARDPALREAARRAYELTHEAAMKAGNMQVAQVAMVRAFDLAQPQP